MFYLFSDVLGQAGGIETYIHSLASHLHKVGIPCTVVVAENSRCVLLDDLIALGIKVYRQITIPGDRWYVRHRCMLLWLRLRLKRGDWVFCVRQPMPALYLKLVRMVHAKGARLAASWMFAPEFLPPTAPHAADFCQAVAETDAVISVSECTVHQFQQIYQYLGQVHVVRYHNLPLFKEPLPLPSRPPWKIAYIGRIDLRQKNLDTLIEAFARVLKREAETELHLHGGGPDIDAVKSLVATSGLSKSVFLHGAYDHRRDLRKILSECHFCVYTSRYEGGPCFSLLELLQAGRFCVASPVGGIPDIYTNHPEAGILTVSTDVNGVTAALLDAIEHVRQGNVDPMRIRDLYERHFSMAAAHRDWLNAVGFASESHD